MTNLISAAIGNTWYLQFEVDFILWLQSLGGKGSFLYYLMNGISMFGETYLIAATIIVLYFGLDKNVGERVAFTMLTAGMLTPMIKNIVCRTRPFDSVNAIQNFRDVGGYSFPSGHTLSSVIGATVLTKANAKFGLAAIPLAALIAFSRLYLYVHYPTDILGAAVLGVAIGLLVCAAGGWVITALTEKGSISDGR